MPAEHAEHGTLFAAPMVRAILGGEKTQTRRRVTSFTSFVDGVHWNQPAWKTLDFETAWVDQGPSPAGNAGPYLKVPRPSADAVQRVYPRWFVGDRIWVRETWGFSAKVTTDGQERWLREHDTTHLIYRADGDHEASPWRPSLHMPRWASRITLEVLEVGVHRLQEMSEADARAEGFPLPAGPGTVNGKPATIAVFDPVLSFRMLWDVLYGKSAPWSSSPWVWAYKFQRIAQAAP